VDLRKTYENLRFCIVYWAAAICLFVVLSCLRNRLTD